MGKWARRLVRKDAGRMPNQPKLENAVGFCMNRIHYGRLSVKMMKRHGCLAKNCPYLIKRTEHEYWEWRDKERRERKEAGTRK